MQCRCVVALDSVLYTNRGTHVGLVDVFHQETETQTSKKRAVELEHELSLGIGFFIVVTTVTRQLAWEREVQQQHSRIPDERDKFLPLSLGGWFGCHGHPSRVFGVRNHNGRGKEDHG
jgi:hypothetical protein